MKIKRDPKIRRKPQVNKHCGKSLTVARTVARTVERRIAGGK